MLDAVLDQLDLTQLVIDRVDLNRVIASVDFEDVVDHIDIGGVVEHVDIDEIVDRLNVERVIARLDMPRLALEVIDQIDLPEIIRASTGTVASESVRVVRMQTFGADRAITRVVDKLLGRGDDDEEVRHDRRPAEEDPPAPRRRRRIGVSTSTNASTSVPAEARGFQGEPAGIASRVLANSVDLAITIGILFAIYGAVAAGLFLRRGARFRFPTVTYADGVRRRGRSC